MISKLSLFWLHSMKWYPSNATPAAMSFLHADFSKTFTLTGWTFLDKVLILCLRQGRPEMDLGHLGGSGGKETSNVVSVWHGVQPKDAPRCYIMTWTWEGRGGEHISSMSTHKGQKNLFFLYSKAYLLNQPLNLKIGNWRERRRQLFSKNWISG